GGGGGPDRRSSASAASWSWWCCSWSRSSPPSAPTRCGRRRCRRRRHRPARRPPRSRRPRWPRAESRTRRDASAGPPRGIAIEDETREVLGLLAVGVTGEDEGPDTEGTVLVEFGADLVGITHERGTAAAPRAADPAGRRSSTTSASPTRGPPRLQLSRARRLPHRRARRRSIR